MSQYPQQPPHTPHTPYTPQAPQVSRGSDNMLGMLMSDSRYFGDINSQASPFALVCPPHESGIPPAALLTGNMRNAMPVHQNPPFYGQIYPNGAAPVRSNAQQLTPNTPITPYTSPSVANFWFNLMQPTPNARQRRASAVRTRPVAQQFRFNPYARGNPPVAAIPRPAIPQHTFYTTQAHPSTIPQRSNSQQHFSHAPNTSYAATGTGTLTPQLRTWNSPSGSDAHAVTAGSQQPATHTYHEPQPVFPVPHTPARIDRASTGLLSPEKTPVTNNQANGNLQDFSGGFYLIVPQDTSGNCTLSIPSEDNTRQSAAAEAPQPQQMPALTTAPDTTTEHISSEASKERSIESIFRDKDAQMNKDNEKEWTSMMDFAGVIRERSCSDVVEQTAQKHEIGKKDAIIDMGSDNYHVYGDHSNFLFHNITLTRVNLIKNNPECIILLTIYEWDLWPPHYTTIMKTYGPGSGPGWGPGKRQNYKLEFLADKTDFRTAFLEFRKAFKKYTRISWEARSVPQEYITASARAWEKQKREQLMFEKVGEQREDGRSRSASPVSREPGETKNASNSKSKKSRTPYQRPEDVLTKEELASCRLSLFRYTPPSERYGGPRGVMPELPGRYPVISGDDPNDGGWTLVAPTD
ncbi:Vitamin k-dependent protein c isoform 1 [Lasiodiplodia theobromae]|uniref:Vitamin k-dependent protein c isoform 1 n=1 Tax=Lasiodiplodia theobromae TaxID=45133 RepID=UPI0015C36504|nr:Vitamin k-dependent protein c isoform 1 [Lasiodiplodia theobromae]KAF4544844.1 Vitamin k-dependent protein c isoform 1 [Lasiodiplodia theobromae]